MSLQQFNLAVDRFIGKTVPEKVQTVHRRLMLQALRGVVRTTPVDTGRARANWLVSIDQRDFSQRNVGSDGAPAPDAESVIAAGSDRIATIQPFSVSYVQNNVSYIEELEHGSSKQAPQGMLAITIAEIQASLK